MTNMDSINKIKSKYAEKIASRNNYYDETILPWLEAYLEKTKDVKSYNTQPAIKKNKIAAIVVKKSDIKHIGDSLLSVVTINGDRIPDTPINCYPRNQIEEFADYIKEQLSKTL